MENLFNIFGHTKIWVNGELKVDQHNAINDGMKDYLRKRMNENTTYKGFTQNLFNYPTQTSGNDGNSERGIIVGAQADFTQSATSAQKAAAIVLTQTTNISDQATNNHAVKLKGTFTATNPKTYDFAQIVVDWVDGDYDSSEFYATNSFQSITLAASDVLTIEWEIYIQ